jgi:hypothetical protein
MKPLIGDARIVSARELQYTDRDQFSWHLIREGAHLCKQNFSVNPAEED